MAKKAHVFSGDRNDPKQNKSLAIRTVAKTMPTAKATEIVAEVKKQFGHSVGTNQVYMIKTKMNIAKRRRAGRKAAASTPADKLSSAAMWVDAIKAAKHLLSLAGSHENAIALLKAL
jgi:hypothetical protein